MARLRCAAQSKCCWATYIAVHCCSLLLFLLELAQPVWVYASSSTPWAGSLRKVEQGQWQGQFYSELAQELCPDSVYCLLFTALDMAGLILIITDCIALFMASG